MIDGEKDIYSIGKGIIRFFYLPSGNLKEILDDSNYFRINTYVGSNFEAQISNLYLLVTEDGKTTYTPLLGVGSPSSFKRIPEGMAYRGEFLGIKYQVILKVFDDFFIYSLDLKKKNENTIVKVFMGQDISIADIGMISSNESYVAQYIDHKVFENTNGFTICSRQNQGRHFYFEMGSTAKTVGYSTDGFQFFGKDYKFNSRPLSLEKGSLENRIYQYEFSYPAIETAEYNLKEDQNFKFYGAFFKNHDEEIRSPIFRGRINAFLENYVFDSIDDDGFITYKSPIDYGNLYEYIPLSDEELAMFYPNQKAFVERKDGKILSFFSDLASHVVISDKERLLERPSGNIFISLPKKDTVYDLEQVFATTSYIYGVFNSQIVYGNVSFNKLLSNTRNPLNVQRVNGERIFIKLGGKYYLLGMPAVFEMGLNYAKWIYKLKDDYLIIENIVSQKDAKSTLYVKSYYDKTYEFLVTNHLTLAQNENDKKIDYKVKKDLITFNFSSDLLVHQRYPEYYFLLKSAFNEYKLYDNNLMALSYHDSNFEITFIGACQDDVDTKHVCLREKQNYYDHFKCILNHLEIKSNCDDLNSYNYLCYWYVHDALIHYLSPHGLEQYNGAAWGTRDVCQGPFELFLALDKKCEMQRIITTVFSHQFNSTYQFPQWFMFDRYVNICDKSSHADVILWPIRMVALYLKATNDYAILKKKISYLDRETFDYVGEETLFKHLQRAVTSVVDSFIEGTHLPAYGNGDWDDTLQPAKAEFKQKMVSGWTPVLAYDVFKMLADAIRAVEVEYANFLDEVALSIKIDYEKYIIKDDLPAGFIHFTGDGLEYIIHPRDDKTGIKYRLLPFVRLGLSRMADKEKALEYNEIIKKNLLFPDGAHLMNTSITYHGGVNTYFQRAETSANFGREIGLQYCHAHIRYSEFLHKLGLNEEFMRELFKINPMIMEEKVKNALPRQRNSYFSSSDGAFYNRYEVAEHFDDLRNGKVMVKSGWRVYSSGPGIYLHNFISSLLGLNIIDNHLAFNPSLAIGDVCLTYRFRQKMIKINYHLGEAKVLINKKQANIKMCEDAFVILDEIADDDIIDVYCEAKAHG